MHDRNRVLGWVGMHTDINDRKLAEAALREADHRKDEFLALLGHELRNPLAALSTAMEVFLTLLPADSALPRVREIVERQVATLTRLVDDLLDVSRIESGRVTFDLRRVDLRSVVGSAIASCEPRIAAMRHRLVVRQAPAPRMVDGDEVRLGQIASNLLDNAVKYTPPAAAITVITREADGKAVLTVADDGIGIDPGQIDCIFKAFRRSAHVAGRPSPGATLTGGRGLGLFSVRRLVELHGGGIEARSGGRGQGAEMIVRIPLAAQGQGAGHAALSTSRSEENTERSRSDAGRQDVARRRILVVDDNRDAADSLPLSLRLTGHDVRHAYDGAAAIDLAIAFRPEVVLLDIGMPDIDRYTLARELRELDATANALIIAVSGYAAAGRSDAEAAIDHHLLEPVDSQRLRSLLSRPRPAAP
jgi:CheY-like chemotaxis protein/nitrogen-specific signal transduction histidine kinase